MCLKESIRGELHNYLLYNPLEREDHVSHFISSRVHFLELQKFHIVWESRNLFKMDQNWVQCSGFRIPRITEIDDKNDEKTHRQWRRTNMGIHYWFIFPLSQIFSNPWSHSIIRERTGLPQSSMNPWSYLHIISLYNFSLDRNMRLLKLPPGLNFGWIRKFFEPRMGFQIKISGCLK